MHRGRCTRAKKKARSQVAPAFRTQRSYRLATPSGTTSLGLDQILGSPDCWVLGPPTLVCRSSPFTTPRMLASTGSHPRERPAHAMGPSHPAPRRDDRGALLTEAELEQYIPS